MQINIISRQANKERITGPKKVLVNACKGLDKLGVKYVFNEPIANHKYNWIHDDQKAIIEAGFVGRSVLVGPNIAVLPGDLPKLRKKLPQGSIYLHPSRWTIDVWKFLGFNEAKLDFWPVGINLDEFEVFDRTNFNKVMVYFKQRDLKLLEKTKEILKTLKIDFELIHYGFYKENDYKKALMECKFGIWIGCSESQGIGLEEALATNLPLIVLDATSLFDTVPTDSKNYFAYEFPKSLKDIQTTTAPYFDERCGIKIKNISELQDAVTLMRYNLASYNPRAYIEENLTLEKSARWLLGFFEKMDIKETKSYNYQMISKVLFYLGLLTQKWAWKWLVRKIIK